jgi:hypothetical protein
MESEIHIPETDESSSSSTILEYIYDDEILPEIEIREVISIDTFLKENPKFVALNQETIFILLKQFFTNNAKAKWFLNLHKTVIDDKNVDILSNIFVHIDAIRKDNEEIEEYFEEQERAKRAPTFELQQLELNKLAYPFDPEKILQDKQYILDEPSHIILKNNEKMPYTPTDISKTLNVDEISLPVLGAYWKLTSLYKLLYLHEMNANKPFTYVKWKSPKISKIPVNESNSESSDEKEIHEDKSEESDEISFDDWLRKFVQPQFKNVISEIFSIDSLHQYALILGQAGYDLNNLSIYQDKLLRKHLQKLFDDDENIEKDSDSESKSSNIKDKSKHFSNTESIFPSLNFLETIQRHHDRYSAYFQEERFYRVQENLGSYIASLPNFQNEIESYDPYTIATQVIQGTRTLEDVKILVNQLNIRANFNRANTLLKQLSASKSYITIEKFNRIYKQTYDSIIDEKYRAFISLYNDITEVKQGNDTSKYDGTPITVSQPIYEETKYETVISENTIEDVSPEEEVYDSIPDLLNEQFTALIDTHEGIKEVFNYVLPYFIKIRDASALQWDINSWIRMYSIEVQRESRSSKILAQIENISPFIVQRICVNSLEVSIQLINDLNTVEIADKLHSIYPTIFKEWKDDCKEAFFNGLTVWLLDSLESSINGTLDFSILNGMLSFADIWAPYGPPLNDKKTSAGIIYYISSIAATILPYDNIQSNSIEERILNISTQKYSDRVNRLKEAWIKIKDKKERQDKATQVKQSLIEASRQLLAKEKINFLPTYVKAYYYLPTFIPKKDMLAFKKQPIWAQGCCLSKLDKTYEADNDWKNHIKPLWSMKNKLAEDRWLTSHRENLTIFKLKNETKSKSPSDKTSSSASSSASFASSNTSSEKTYFEKQHECFIQNKKDQNIPTQIKFTPNDIWLQKSHYDILYREAREGSSTLTKQCIQLAYQRIKAEKILPIIESLFQLNDINHILIKIIQNINIKLETVRETSIEKTILENTKVILYDMKNIFKLFLNATGTEYTSCIYRARYILGRALCLPGIPQNNKLSIPDNVSATFYANILKDNYNIITQWDKNNSMLTPFEIQAYITKMREEQKKTTLNKLDVLSVDDMQLMKDVKRFGLMKVLETTQQSDETVSTDNGTGTTQVDDTGVQAEINEDQDGEAEWLQPSTDQDVYDEDILDSIL